MTEAVFVERMASSYLSPQEGFAAMDTQMDGCLTEAGLGSALCVYTYIYIYI